MSVVSAGLLPYRLVAGHLQVFLTHMGGPFWEHKDEGAWSIAKGEYDPAEESPPDVARREFAEEVGLPAPPGDLVDLGWVRVHKAKTVRTYALETDADLRFVSSNLFTMEWPRGSGRVGEFPECDGAAWFDAATARTKIMPSQVPILESLAELVASHRLRDRSGRPRNTLAE